MHLTAPNLFAQLISGMVPVEHESNFLERAEKVDRVPLMFVD